MVLPIPGGPSSTMLVWFDEGEGGQVADLAGVKVGWSVQLHLK